MNLTKLSAFCAMLTISGCSELEEGTPDAGSATTDVASPALDVGTPPRDDGQSMRPDTGNPVPDVGAPPQDLGNPPSMCELAEGSTCAPSQAAPNCCASGFNCAVRDGSGSVCCRGMGSPCSSNRGCCGSLECRAGICAQAVVTGCDAIAQSNNGCPSSTPRCDYAEDGSTLCAAAELPSRATGSACMTSFQCSVGDSCNVATSPGRCRRRCLLARNNADCAAGTYCVESGSAAGHGMCSPLLPCSPVAMSDNGCAASRVICQTLSGSGGARVFGCVAPTSTPLRSAGQSCGSTSDCVPGHTCLTSGGVSVCARNCLLGSSTCTGGRTCLSVSHSTMTGYGVCH
jgi:hypothetical protein